MGLMDQAGWHTTPALTVPDVLERCGGAWSKLAGQSGWVKPSGIRDWASGS